MTKKAFTLVEMLVVVLMVSVMMVIMAPTMTKKVTEPQPQVKIVGGSGEVLPAGTIVLYMGGRIPDGWVECDGQSVNPQAMPDLMMSAPQVQNIPNLNQAFEGTDTDVKWIVKVRN